jgi:hypothetical protein
VRKVNEPVLVDDDAQAWRRRTNTPETAATWSLRIPLPTSDKLINLATLSLRSSEFLIQFL